jgi:F-type H+-transporting ATPase subunit b
MISLDFSVFYQVVLFVVLWLILSKILFRPYLQLLEQREYRTSGARHETEALESEGQRLRAEYEAKMAEVETAGETAKNAIVEEARKQRELIVNEAREHAARELEQVRREIDSQLQEERKRATAETATMAQDMAAKLLGRSIA